MNAKTAASGVRSAIQNVPLSKRPRTGGIERASVGAVAVVTESFLVEMRSLRCPFRAIHSRPPRRQKGKAPASPRSVARAGLEPR